MKEFMLYIRNEKDAKKSLTEEQHLAFIKKCEAYIGVLQSENKLIAAQPIAREGVVLKKTGAGWIEKDIATTGKRRWDTIISGLPALLKQ